MPELELKYKPRDYQLPIWKARHSGFNRTIKVWHRRAGKDLDDFAFCMDQAIRRPNVYWHVFPEYAQARKAVWENMTADGRRYIDILPPEIIKNKSDQEMRIELKNGSIYRLMGGDVDRIVGAGPAGVIMSEYSLHSQHTWDYIEPMVLEKNGWAHFNGTPRGENHFFDLVQMAKKSPDWFLDIKTVDDTGVISKEQIQRLRDEGKREEHIQQEYYCSFAGVLEGAFYADQIIEARNQGRIGVVPHDETKEVYTFWDLGGAGEKSDYTAIWFVQVYPTGAYHLIDYWQGNGMSLPDIVRDVIKAKTESRRFNYGRHFIPHDAKNTNRQTGETDEQLLINLNLPVEVVPRTKSVRSDVDKVRAMIPRCYFDEIHCNDGIKALSAYRQEQDKDGNWKFKHDWSSHAADGFRYFATHVERVNIARRVTIPNVKRLA